MPTIHLIHGFMGTGKTTFAKKLERETRAVRVTIDEWVLTLFGQPDTQAEQDVVYRRVYDLVYDVWPRIATAGADVILDFGFWRRASRDKARRIAADVGATPRLYMLSCPEPVARERCRNRNDSAESSHFRVSDRMFDELRQRFEPLDADEPRQLIETGDPV